MNWEQQFVESFITKLVTPQTKSLEDRYAKYLMEHKLIGNGDMLLSAMERGDLLSDFCDSIGITIEQFEEAV
jgi:hypothetical protein